MYGTWRFIAIPTKTSYFHRRSAIFYVRCFYKLLLPNTTQSRSHLKHNYVKPVLQSPVHLRVGQVFPCVFLFPCVRYTTSWNNDWHFCSTSGRIRFRWQAQILHIFTAVLRLFFSVPPGTWWYCFLKQVTKATFLFFPQRLISYTLKKDMSNTKAKSPHALFASTLNQFDVIFL